MIALAPSKFASMPTGNMPAPFLDRPATRPTLLVVDDDYANRKLLSAVLETEGFNTVQARDGLEALALLAKGNIAGVISDVLMPNMDGYTLCSQVRRTSSCSQVPFIIYTSTYTHAADEQLALGFGADGYLRKPASGQVVAAMMKQIIEERAIVPVQIPPQGELGVMKQYSEALVRKLEKRGDQLLEQTQVLHRSENRLRAIFEAEPDGVHVSGRDGKVTEINPAGLSLYEADSIAQLAADSMARFVVPEHHQLFEAATAAVWRGEKSCLEFEVVALRGTRRWLELHAAPLLNPQGDVVAMLGITRDNTARRELELQFVQAQKMEVVGQLAGGIAHDFNNMIGIIMGYSEIVLGQLTDGTEMHSDLLRIFHTAQRAAALTRQLLIFTRMEMPEPTVIDLSDLVAAIDPMLRRLIGENITMLTRPSVGLGTIEADPGQIEQVLMNLIVNARDAMPAGGTIVVSTSAITVALEDRPPADYVVLAVADDGCGMSPEVKAKIFEPFFTTKLPGSGTGLGLATCQTIARRWGGYITVDSEVGGGTKFQIYFPVVQRSFDMTVAADQPGTLPGGTETILVVEDEPGLLELAASVLERQGYEVLRAGNGQEALKIVQHHRGKPIDLVVTDMVMPVMGGRAMAEWLCATNPEIKILFTSGYTECGLDDEFAAGIAFLAKPYTPSALTRKARAVLDAPVLAPKPACR